MQVVRFLERKNVIRFFGVSLILAPFINLALHVVVLKITSHTAWSEFQIWPALKSTGLISAMLALCSVLIGFTLLSGAQKAWKYVLILVGAYLLVQILNVGSQAWNSPLAWPSFILNTAIFFFIFDQLVWKVKVQTPNLSESKPEAAVSLAPSLAALPQFDKFKTVINLKSYRKILFSFGSDKPWGELKTLSSEMLSVKVIALVPDNISDKVVQINFARDVVVDIQFQSRENELVYFKPLNLDKEKVTNLNKWLRKIAV